MLHQLIRKEVICYAGARAVGWTDLHAHALGPLPLGKQELWPCTHRSEEQGMWHMCAAYIPLHYLSTLWVYPNYACWGRAEATLVSISLECKISNASSL